ncbi:hypothetical protein CFP71_13385 [Amycolatopsis thailandensis]|uniref:Uncharacterized protein n=1 Tax=Amycolatopsis thailandensis TaxID=589330 RepID=A0A229SBY1_9PSEU|nr:hypothetical protein [Amycolatopsis thailandensis]OXM56416.1 hypothetical protein CFP71_13385 [Amycolatopsis thailandensis]
MSSTPTNDSGHLESIREVEIDGSRYVLTTSADPARPDTVVIDLLGAGADAEVTLEGHLTASRTALEHLGPLLSEALSSGQRSTTRKPRRRGYGKPTQSYHPWTDELRAALHAAWTAADPSVPALQVVEGVAAALDVPVEHVKSRFEGPESTRDPARLISVIAILMQRTDGAILNQLPRQNLDPERPGPQPEDARQTTG